jgi:predicted DNA-binding transcriptional regulator YafY
VSPARTPDTSAAGRLQRLLALVPWVLDHPGATVDEVCERFEMTRETLIADLELLYVTGVPPYGRQGPHRLRRLVRPRPPAHLAGGGRAVPGRAGP